MSERFTGLSARRGAGGWSGQPAILEKRLSISPQGRVRCLLNLPSKNRTVDVEFEVAEFQAGHGQPTSVLANLDFPSVALLHDCIFLETAD